MTILGVTRRPLLTFPIPRREIDPSILTPESPSELDKELSTLTRDIPKIPSMTRTVINDHIIPINSSLPARLQSPAEELLPTLRTKAEWVGEVMHATEGLVCVLAFFYAARRRKAGVKGNVSGDWTLKALATSSNATSFIPFVYVLLSRYFRRSSSDRDTTALLADTYMERDRNLLWYFLRGSLWHNYTRVKAMRILGWMSKVWGLNLVANLVEDHVRLADELYYCESTA